MFHTKKNDPSEEKVVDDQPPRAVRNLAIKHTSEINVTTKSSRTNSIKIVMQRDNTHEDYSIREVMIKDGSQADNPIGPRHAIKALNVKAREISKSKETVS